MDVHCLGMMYFVLLCVERILNLSGQKSWLGWIYTVFFFIAGNVVFRSRECHRRA